LKNPNVKYEEHINIEQKFSAKGRRIAWLMKEIRECHENISKPSFQERYYFLKFSCLFLLNNSLANTQSYY
jgi:hypothetical protein